MQEQEKEMTKLNYKNYIKKGGVKSKYENCCFLKIIYLDYRSCAGSDTGARRFLHDQREG